MADNVVRHEKYVCVDSEFNKFGHNKFYEIFVFADGTFRSIWGRVGGTTQQKDFPGAGNSFADSKVAEKLKKGYRKIDTVDQVEDHSSRNSSASVNNSNLKKIAREQIQHSSPVVKQLIDYLTEQNAHNILVSSGGRITYSADTGLFKTPLGIVTPATVDEARKLLTQIGDWVNDNDWDNRSFVRALNDYMMLIPQDLGMGMKFGPRTVFPDLVSVQKQNDVLDSLETSYASVIAAPKDDGKKDDKKTDAPKIFDVKMELVDDKGEIKRIEHLYYSTQNKHYHYDAVQYKIKQIFSLEMPSCRDIFEKKGKPLGSLFQVFHGGSTANCLSILKSGLKCSPPRSAHLTGSMFGGHSIYTSDMSSKAVGYCIGVWGGGRSNRVFLFAADVAMGKYYVPRGPDSSLPKPGYDSTFAKGGTSGVLHNELVVYQDYQVNLTHMIELEK